MKWNGIIPPKIWTIFCWNFEIWAVQRIVNLVDLEKCWKMLKNAPTLAIVAVHTEKNEPPKFGGPKFHYFNPLLNTYVSMLRWTWCNNSWICIPFSENSSSMSNFELSVLGWINGRKQALSFGPLQRRIDASKQTSTQGRSVLFADRSDQILVGKRWTRSMNSILILTGELKFSISFITFYM